LQEFSSLDPRFGSAGRQVIAGRAGDRRVERPGQVLAFTHKSRGDPILKDAGHNEQFQSDVFCNAALPLLGIPS
jgi:hypothetical protein